MEKPLPDKSFTQFFHKSSGLTTWGCLVKSFISGEMVGLGTGKAKKEAQQAAAKQALEVLNALEK
ncbi:MAG TPA: putative dsRNA-binding protein [Coleofasciculaceae cyanobacterium]|jgi:dsRNA-specific ribonuclease